MKDVYPLYLNKNEDIETYKKFAETGMDLMFPVKLKGKTHRHDINVPYHTTIKLFDTKKDTAEQVHEVAKNLALNPPIAKDVGIEPTTLQGQGGYTMHVLKLHGPYAEEIQEHHKKFSHLGFKESYVYAPHITVDKETWDEIVASKVQNAGAAGIEFLPAELRQGEKILADYAPKIASQPGGDVAKEDRLRKYENISFSLMRGTIAVNAELNKKHGFACSMNEQTFLNYLNDNKDLKECILEKCEERLKFHFGDDRELLEIGWQKGIAAAYEKSMNRK